MRLRRGALMIAFASAAFAGSIASADGARPHPMVASTDPCAASPALVAAAVAREPGWSPVRLNDLVADDLALWKADRPDACPGFASARLGVGTGPAFAIALLRTSSRGAEEKVLLLIPEGDRVQERLLARPHTITHPEVVWRTGPGQTRAWDGGPTIDVAHDSIIWEAIEARAQQFFFVGGQLRSVVTSN